MNHPEYIFQRNSSLFEYIQNEDMEIAKLKEQLSENDKYIKELDDSLDKAKKALYLIKSI